MKFKIDKQDLARLDQDKLKKGIAALRSGKYKQHEGTMTDQSDSLKACCLMVIAQEVDGMPWEQALMTSGSVLNISYALPTSIPFLIDLGESLSIKLEALRVTRTILNDGSDWTSCSVANLNDSYLTHPQIGELFEKGELTVDLPKFN